MVKIIKVIYYIAGDPRITILIYSKAFYISYRGLMFDRTFNWLTRKGTFIGFKWGKNIINSDFIVCCNDKCQFVLIIKGINYLKCATNIKIIKAFHNYFYRFFYFALDKCFSNRWENITLVRFPNQLQSRQHSSPSVSEKRVKYEFFLFRAFNFK